MVSILPADGMVTRLKAKVYGVRFEVHGMGFEVGDMGYEA